MKTSNKNLLQFAVVMLMVQPLVSWAAGASKGSTPKRCVELLRYRDGVNAQDFNFTMSNLEVASLTDATNSTGATLFYFPQAARVNVDARGGSVASSETQLFSEGSYSNFINGVVFSGGSTMGLAAADGVRQVLFARNASRAGAFDLIPSVPSAVVYDFEGRIEAGRNALVYPDSDMGKELMNRLSPQTFRLGRAGAGVSTTVNKDGNSVWGGQGAYEIDLGYAKVFVAVVVNAVGDIVSNGTSLTKAFKPVIMNNKPHAQHNTTLSLVVTDAKLSRNQLKRLATMVHTSMAQSIWPFHSYYDGDIQFTVSNGNRVLSDEQEWNLSIEAAAAMKQAIQNAVRTANAP